MIASAVAAAVSASASDRVIVQTDAYRWAGDTIFQNEFKAWAESPYELKSTYKGRPGYFMPISQSWVRNVFASTVEPPAHTRPVRPAASEAT